MESRLSDPAKRVRIASLNEGQDMSDHPLRGASGAAFDPASVTPAALSCLCGERCCACL